MYTVELNFGNYAINSIKDLLDDIKENSEYYNKEVKDFCKTYFENIKKKKIIYFNTLIEIKNFIDVLHELDLFSILSILDENKFRIIISDSEYYD